MGELDDILAKAAQQQQPAKPTGFKLPVAVAAPLAVAGSVPDYLLGAAAKGYAAFAPGFTQAEKQAAIESVPSATQRYDELLQYLTGKRYPYNPYKKVTDVAKTAGELGAGAVGFMGDVVTGVGTQLNPALFGERALGKLTPQEEAYLRNIPASPVSQMFAIDTGEKVGPVQGTTRKVFEAVTGAAKKYVGEPVTAASGDPALGEFASNLAMLAAPVGAGKVFKKVRGGEKVAERVEVKPVEGAEMVSVEEVVEPTAPVEAAKPLSRAEELRGQKAILEESLLEKAPAQTKRQIKNKIKELDEQIGDAVRLEEFAKATEDVISRPETIPTKPADALREFTETVGDPDVAAAEAANRAKFAQERLMREYTIPDAQPEALGVGVPSGVPDYWSALRGKLPEAVVETKGPEIVEATIGMSPLERLNSDLRAREKGFTSHEEYLKALKETERVSGEGPHGSLTLAPVTSSTVELKQVTGNKTNIQSPRKKGVTYEVNIDAQGNKTIARVNFDPVILSPEEVAAFKEKYNKPVAQEAPIEAKPFEDTRFVGEEATLRDKLLDLEDAYMEKKMDVREQLLTENPAIKNTPEYLKALEDHPELSRLRGEVDAARSALNKHLGVTELSPEADIANILAKQPKSPEMRKLSPIIGDVLTLAKEAVKDERGSVGGPKTERSAEASAAMERLKNDARNLGRSFSDHLQKLGFPDAVIEKVAGEKPTLGGVGVTREALSKLDGTDLNSSKVRVFTHRDGSQSFVSQAPLYMKELRQLGEIASNPKNTGKSILTMPIYMMEKLGGPWKELYDNYNKQNTIKIRNIEAMEKSIDKFKEGMTRDELKLAYWVAVARRAGGIDRLKASGIELPAQVPKRIMDKAVEAEAFFKDYFTRLNEMRVKNGLDPVEGVKNYVTFFGDVANVADRVGVEVWKAPDLMEYVNDNLKNTTFRFAKRTSRGSIDPDMTLSNAMRTYGRVAEHHINIQPIVAKGKAMLGEYKVDPFTGKDTKESWSFKRANPDAARGVEEWLDAIGVGKRVAKVISQDQARKLGRFQAGMSGAMVAYNVNTLAAQPSSLVTVPALVGVQGVVKGLGVMHLRNFKTVEAMSNVIDARSMNAEIKSYAQRLDSEGFWQATTDTARHIGMIPTGLIDHAMAYYTWWAAYQSGLGRGLGKSKAAIFADDVVVKTQASGDIGHVSKLQTSSEGAALAMLGTYKIAFGNFVYHEMLRNPEKSTYNKLKTAIITGGAMVGLNMIYNSLGIDSPLPEPEWTYKEKRDKGFSEGQAAFETAKDFAYNVIGGSSQYGMSLPLFQVTDILRGATDPERFNESLAKSAGIALGGAGVPGITAARRFVSNEGLERFVSPTKREGTSPFD